MIKKGLIYAIYIFFIVLIQSTLLDYIKIFSIKPNLLIVFIISVSLLRGNIEGAIVGFFTGFMQDIVSGKILGFYSLLGLYLGLIVGSLNKRIYRENFLVIIFFTFVSTVAYELTVCLLNMISRVPIDFLYSLRATIIPEAIYNSVVSIIVFIFVMRLHERLVAISRISRKY